MKRFIKDFIVISILAFILSTAYEHFTGNKYELFSLTWGAIMFISIGLSYIVDHLLEKHFKMKF